MRSKGRSLASIAAIFALSIINIGAPAIAKAALVTATGTNASACNQVTSNATGVTALRSGQDCIVTFTNTTAVTWTVPMGVTNVSAIIVGGGGGGGDSTSSATGGGGGGGGFFANSNISVSGDLTIAVGAGGSGSSLTTQGATGGTSYIGSLKVGGGGGGNGYNYVGGLRAGAGAGGSDFLSSGSGGGGRPTGTGVGAENQGGLAGAFAGSGLAFLGFTYTGVQGVAGSANSDGASGGMGGTIANAATRTSSISGSSVIYSKISQYRPWEDAQSGAGTKTPGSGGSPNYGYGVDPTVGGGAGADGVVIIRYTLASAILAPTFSGLIYKGTSESVTVTVNMPGKVRFFIDGKRIPGCLAVSTTGSLPSITATCTWKPAVHGLRSVYATLTPSDGTTASAASPKTSLPVLRRSSSR